MRSPRQLYELVNRLSAERVAELLGLERARERGKYVCPEHGGDSLHAYRGDGNGFYCWGACQRAYSAIDLGMAVWGVTHGEACQRLAEAAGLSASHPLPYHPPPAARRAPPTPPPRPSVEAHPALKRLRDEGMAAPELPPVVYGAVLDALTLTSDGATYLRGRGFDPVEAGAYGFRAVDDAREWSRLHAALTTEFCPDVLEAAGLYQPRDGKGDADWSPPWGGRVSALLIPYMQDGACVSIRFRSLDPNSTRRYHTLGGRSPDVPFNVDALHGVVGQTVHVVEGELNAYAMGLVGCRAIGLPGAAIWRTEWSDALREAATVVAWFDDDPPRKVGDREVLGAGHKAAAKLRGELVAQIGRTWVDERVRTVFLPRDAGVPLDPNDLFQRGALRAYVDAALR